MFITVFIAISTVLATGCGGGGSPEGDDRRIRVIAAFYPLAAAASRIAGEAAIVENITPAGTEPHDVELTANQVDALEDADLIVYVGGGFQPALEEIVDRRDGRSLDVLEAVGVSGDDPHFWLDLALYGEAIEAVAAAMADAAPDERARFEDKADEFGQVIDSLDQEFMTGLATCTRRTFVTTHAAFGFLADRYDLEQLSVSGLAPESEPDPERLDDLAHEIERSGITTVFYEDLVAPDVAETLAREVGVGTAVLSPLEGLTQEQVDRGEDYVSVMRQNLAALRKALGCS